MNATAGYVIEFFDRGELQERENVNLLPTVAEKHPANPVLALGADGEFDSKQVGNWAGDIHWDAEAGLFKCWYYASDIDGTPAIGYATSEDGVLWERPRLGPYD